MDHILVPTEDRSFTYLTDKNKVGNHIYHNIFNILYSVAGIQYPKSQIVREFDRHNLWTNPGVMSIFSMNYVTCIRKHL